MYEAQWVYMTSSLLKLVCWNNGLNSKVMKNEEQNPAFKRISNTCHFQVFFLNFLKKNLEKTLKLHLYQGSRDLGKFCVLLFIYNTILFEEYKSDERTSTSINVFLAKFCKKLTWKCWFRHHYVFGDCIIGPTSHILTCAHCPVTPNPCLLVTRRQLVLTHSNVSLPIPSPLRCRSRHPVEVLSPWLVVKSCW